MCECYFQLFQARPGPFQAVPCLGSVWKLGRSRQRRPWVKSKPFGCWQAQGQWRLMSPLPALRTTESLSESFPEAFSKGAWLSLLLLDSSQTQALLLSPTAARRPTPQQDWREPAPSRPPPAAVTALFVKNGSRRGPRCVQSICCGQPPRSLLFRLHDRWERGHREVKRFGHQDPRRQVA